MSPTPTPLVRIRFLTAEGIRTLAEGAAETELLSSRERERAARFARDGDRRRFVAARVLLRRMLEEELGAPAESFRFQTDEHGRPHLASSPSCAFSISHTEGMVACAVGRVAALGVDVENRKRGAELMKVARRCFAPEEVRYLEARPGGGRDEAFFRLWTLKEAYLKAKGRGLSLGLDTPRFALDDSGIPTEFRSRLEGNPEAWRFLVDRPGPELVLACAAYGARVTFALREDPGIPAPPDPQVGRPRP
ncbi:MAG: 4'-phosphopantetheinyl transferase family protein [Gemmatimonadota bacterium]